MVEADQSLYRINIAVVVVPLRAFIPAGLDLVAAARIIATATLHLVARETDIAESHVVAVKV